jgi:putative DNA primase/helicase
MSNPRTGDESPAHLVRQSRAAWCFAQMVGDQIRFDHGRGRWLNWSGHRWRPDEDGHVQRLWLDVLAMRYRRALLADDRERVRLTAEVQAAGATNSAIVAGLDIASSMDPIATTADAWDPDPWLLGCENGVVDLRTGHLRPGRPDDMISRSTGIAFEPDAPCPRWMRFLQEVFAGDEELVAWYGLLVGTSLVGVMQELLAIHHGLGNNGKSVAIRAVRHALGDYAVVIPVETLVNAKRSAGEATPDLMALRGARIAFTSEPDQAAKLRGGVLKRLASVDQMTGRSLYGSTQTWEPTHTVHLATNHLPAVDDDTTGFWRRVALVPWTVRFRKPGEDGDAPPEDPDLAATLASEGPGILAWAVRGAVAHANGRTLDPFPAAVRVRTEAYRADEDKLGGFVAECVVYERGASVAVGVLHDAYRAWCERESVPPTERLGRKFFARGFQERGRGVERVLDETTNRVVFTGARLALSTDSGSSGDSTSFAGSPHTNGESGKSGNRPGSPESPRTPAASLNAALSPRAVAAPSHPPGDATAEQQDLGLVDQGPR